MPLYKYECEGCGSTFKKLQQPGQTNGKDPKCPNCGSLAVSKVIPQVGIRFKGSGFYRTDYKGNGNGKTTSTSPESESNGSDSGD